MKNWGRIALLAGFALFIVAFFAFDLGRFFSLDYVKQQQSAFEEYYQNNPVTTIAIYMVVYIVNAAASLPTAAVLTLLGGALFGTVTGTIIVSFASTIGATLAFLASRFILRDWVQEKFSNYLTKVNKGIEDEGAFYLFTVRMIPAVPFFVVNLVMGLTPMKAATFFFVSQIGMLAGTAVYVNAGTQLAQIDSFKGILSPKLILSFVLLALFPLIAKKIMGMVKKKN